MRLFACVMLSAVFLSPAFAQIVPADAAPRISLEEFKKLRASGGVIIVDTRNPDAYHRGHIPGAILLPLEGQQIWPREYEKTVDDLKAANKAIATYCA